MEMILLELRNVKNSPTLATNRLNLLENEDKDFLEKLVDICLSLNFQQQIRTTSLVIFTRFLSMKVSNIKIPQFLRIDQMMDLILRLLLDTQCLNLKDKRLLASGLREFINNVGFNMKKIRSICNLILSQADKLTIFIVLQSLISSKIDRIIILQTIGQFGNIVIQLGSSILQNLNSVTNQILKGGQYLKQDFQKKLFELKYLMEILHSIIQTFTAGQRHNSTFRGQIAQKIVKNDQLGKLLLGVIGYKCENTLLCIICSIDFQQKGFQINEIKELAFKIYNVIIKITDNQFNITDSSLQIYFTIPTIISFTILDLEKVSVEYQKINNEVSIEELTKQMYVFLTQSLKFREIYQVFYKINPITIISILMPFIKTQQNEFQLFQEDSEQFMNFMEDVYVNQAFSFHQSIISKLILRMGQIIDGFASFFFMVCSQTIMDYWQIKYDISTSVEPQLKKYDQESAWSGLIILSSFYKQRMDLAEKIRQIYRKIQPEKMSNLELYKMFMFLKYNWGLFDESLLQDFIIYGLEIDGQLECESLSYCIYQFLYVLLGQKHQQIMEDQEYIHKLYPYQPNYKISNKIKKTIYLKIQNSTSSRFYQTIKRIIDTVHTASIIQQKGDLIDLVDKIRQRLLLLLSKKYYDQQLKTQLLNIIKVLIQRNKQPKYNGQISQMILSHQILCIPISHKKQQQLDDFLQIFAQIVRSGQVVPQQSFMNMIQVIINHRNGISQDWMTSMVYLLQNINDVKFTIQNLMGVYQIIYEGLNSMDNLHLCRLNVIIQFLLKYRRCEVQSQQFKIILNIIQRKLSEQVILLEQKKQQTLSPITIIHFANTYLLGITQSNINNDLSLVIQIISKIVKYYDKYSINVFLQGLYFTITQNNNSKIVMNEINLYLAFAVQILKNNQQKKYDLTYSLPQEELISVTYREFNYYTQQDCFSKFRQIINSLMSLQFNRFQSKLQLQISQLMRVQEIKGKPRILYKIKQPL